VKREAVLAETALHLGSSAPVLALLHDGSVRFTFVLGEHISRDRRVGGTLGGSQPGLADLYLISQRIAIRGPR
jgi:hypothetical protein